MENSGQLHVPGVVFCGKELSVTMKYGERVVFRAGLYAVERNVCVCVCVCVCQDSNVESLMFQSVSWSSYTIVSVLNIHAEFRFLEQTTPEVLMF